VQKAILSARDSSLRYATFGQSLWGWKRYFPQVFTNTTLYAFHKNRSRDWYDRKEDWKSFVLSGLRTL